MLNVIHQGAACEVASVYLSSECYTRMDLMYCFVPLCLCLRLELQISVRLYGWNCIQEGRNIRAAAANQVATPGNSTCDDQLGVLHLFIFLQLLGRIAEIASESGVLLHMV